MASNEDYLDELLKSMSSNSADDSALSRLHSIPEEPAPVEVQDMGMGKMDQAMIDALLAGAASEPVEEPVPVEETGMEPTSMLAKLMAEMQEEAGDSIDDGFSEDDFMSEAGIEALLNAAQNTENDIYDDQVLSFDINNDSDMAEIEALLNMVDNEEPIDDNSELLKLLSEDDDKDLLKNLELDGFEVDSSFEETKDEFSFDGLESNIDLNQLDGEFDLSQFEAELDLEQLEAELDSAFGETSGSTENGQKEDKKKGKKEKKEKKSKEGKEDKEDNKEKKNKGKNIFSKIFSLLMEEVPDDEEAENGQPVSEENKKILEELDQEEDKKIKVKEKKAKKEKKEKKEKPKKDKPKKEKPKKEKKPKKVKVVEPYVPEKKIPRKKVIISFVFAFSLMVLILLVEFLLPPMITVGNARVAYEKGDYYEAYKEYYGQKLSEEDEKRFQAATVIMRMQSNLDAYYNYIKLNDEIMAIHSLLEGVHNKFDIFEKAGQLDVLSQVSAVYDKILGILNDNYHISEEEALELINEKSDAVYTRKLEAIAEDGEYTDVNSEQTNWEDMLPEEENLFENNGE